MGILGSLPPDQMIQKLQGEVNNWQESDTSMTVQPALHYVTVIAQRSLGASGKYRLRMPFHQIEKILEIAKTIDALVFLDIQVGHSTVQEEIAQLEKYHMLPHVTEIPPGNIRYCSFCLPT